MSDEYRTIILKGVFDPDDGMSHSGYLTVVISTSIDFASDDIEGYGYDFGEYYGATL